MATLAPKIIHYSEKENFDTIIMGHSGMSGFKKMLLGSVSNQVINPNKKCTVVISQRMITNVMDGCDFTSATTHLIISFIGQLHVTEIDFGLFCSF